MREKMGLTPHFAAGYMHWGTKNKGSDVICVEDNAVKGNLKIFVFVL